MLPSEVFSIEYSEWERERFIDPASRYWALEMEIAERNDAMYCDLEECDIESRTCAMCGSVNDVNVWGWLPRECNYDKCQDIRSYWGISEAVYMCVRMSCDKARAGWLRTRIKSVFETGGTLSHITKELRFDFLLNAMIERMSIEDRKNNTRAA